MSGKKSQPLKDNVGLKDAISTETNSKGSPLYLLLSTDEGKGLGNTTNLLIAGIIAFITWLVFKGSLENLFTNWDDPGYIQDNTFIKDLSVGGIRRIFSNPVMGNYHPLTILSYAIEYSYIKFEPWLYHIDSLVLHLANTILVYWLVLKLSGKPIVAILASLLFGIHPMHVESVVWISGRKDVLYGLFYLLSCIFYLNYTNDTNNKKGFWYSISLLMFLLSLLSKGVAVTLPLSFLLFDYLKGRPFGKAVFIEKIPYFLLSIVFGVTSVMVQEHAGAMVQKIIYNPIERVVLGFFALYTYLWKLFLPIKLCNFYPYPSKVGGTLPFWYFVIPLVVLALAFLIWKLAAKNRKVVFGVLFFLANIALLLQFLPVGDALVAERYTYIPYLGLFYLAGELVYYLINEGKANKVAVFIIVIVYVGTLSVLSYQRCPVWYNAISLWRDELEKEPVDVPAAYNNLGYIYYGKWAATQDNAEKHNYYDSTMYLLQKCISLDSDFVTPYITLGEIYRNMGKFDEAKQIYYKGIRKKPKETNLYVGLGILFYINKAFDSCGYCFGTALKIDPNAVAYSNYGNYLLAAGKGDSAIINYTVAIKMSPEMYAPYLNRGKEYAKRQEWDKAISDFDNVIRLLPEASEAFLERSKCYKNKGNKLAAINDFNTAMSMGAKPDTALYLELSK